MEYIEVKCDTCQAEYEAKRVTVVSFRAYGLPGAPPSAEMTRTVYASCPHCGRRNWNEELEEQFIGGNYSL